MRTILSLVFLACATACAAQTAEAPADPPESPDAIGMATSPDAAPPMPGPEAAPDAAPAVMPDARPATGPDARADSLTHAPDGGTEAAPVTPSPEGGDGRATEPPTGDGGGSDGGAAVTPVCDMPSVSSCANALRADDEIRSTFTAACVAGDRQCGAVDSGGHVVVTYPMVCNAGTWRLAGSWASGAWSSLYSCSRGCGAAGTMCAP
jgi:hypothetical protein